MKTILLNFLLLILVGEAGYSQTLIKGSVLDAKTIPISNVTIVAYSGTIQSAMAVSDSMGQFTLSSTVNFPLHIKIKCIGYITKDTVITNNPIINIQFILLENIAALNEVKIGARKPLIERKIDRLIFNVENSLAAQGGDALDVLKASPGIDVETNTINMVNRSHLRVMIDNVFVQLSGEDLVNFLKSINSANIKNVEIISNPPAKYDAAGNSGIININLKKPLENSFSATLRGSLTQATYLSKTGGASFDYNRNKLSFYFNVNYNRSKTKRTEGDRFEYPEQNWNTDYDKIFLSKLLGTRLGMEYKFSKNYTTGIQYLGSFNRPNSNENDRLSIINNRTSILDSTVRSVSSNNVKSNTSSLNWHHNIRLDNTGSKLDINLDYLNYNNHIDWNLNSANFYPDETPTADPGISRNYNGKQTLKNYAIRADFETPLKKGTLSYGAKVSFSKTQNDISAFNTALSIPVIDPTQSDSFDYVEHIQSIYLSINQRAGSKWLFQSGLRIEHSFTQGTSHTLNQLNQNDYTNLFPTIYISYNPNSSHSFVLDFGRRIDRPSFGDINPFRFYSNAYSYTEGNPYLKPMFGNMVTLTHTYKYNLSTSLYYSIETNGYDELPIVDAATNTQHFTMQNFYTAQGIGIIETYNFNKLRWWESNLFGFLWYGITKFKANINLPENNGFGAHFSANNSFLINSKNQLKAEFDISVHTPKSDLVYQKRGYSNVNAGFSLPLFKKRMDATIMAYDIFRTDTRNFVTSTGMVKQNYFSYNDGRSVRISLAYHFGNKKINAKKANFGNQDELNRTQQK